MNSVHEQCPGRDTKWPNSRGQVATSNPGCDLTLANPGRDLKAGSRLLFLPQTEQARSRSQNGVATPSLTGQVAMSIPCRNLLSVPPKQPRSRPQTGVETLLLLPSAESGREAKTKSRPSLRLTYVATSSSCSDFVSAHSGISRSRPLTLLPMSLPQNNVATSIPTGQITTQFSGCNSKRPSHVATSNPCRGANPSSPGRDTNWTSRPRLFWPRSRARCQGPGRALTLSCVAAPAMRTCCPVYHDPKSGSRPNTGIWQ